VKHAVVTGAGSGIGAEIVARLVAGGYRVSLMGRRMQALEQSAGATGNSGHCQCVRCDVSDEASTGTAFTQAVTGFGKVDILVNCAGQAPTAPFHKLASADWNQVIGVNLTGVFHCTSQVIAGMREQGGGRIINIASTAALKGYAYVSAYCAAKHGVLGLTRALALETAQLGITVNAICPGYTDTDIIRGAVANIVDKTGRTEAQALQEFTHSNPQARLIQPEEIADTVLWLCSDSARSITGQAISVSGGETT
jgi:NAD(P)-dependent dehydrogenase (short-subunit alcohol dehydrogenase family)